MLRWYKAQQCFQPSITETTHANSQYFVYTELLSFWMHGNKREQGSRLWTMPWSEASVILHFTVLFLIEAKVIVGLSIEMLKEAFFCLIGSWFHREGGKCSGLLMGDKGSDFLQVREWCCEAKEDRRGPCLVRPGFFWDGIA